MPRAYKLLHRAACAGRSCGWRHGGVFCASVRYYELAKKYDPKTLKYGYNTVDGEEIYYIPNPALGLWINREKF